MVPRPPPARSFAIPSKAPQISVHSACGNVVWRKVALRPRSCSSPSGSPTPPRLPSPSPPSARAPRRPPSRTGRAAARPPEQTWNSLPVPLRRNLGQLGLEAASRSRSRSPGAARASGSPGAGRVWSVLLRGMERTCRSAWSKDCSVAGGGDRLRQLPAVRDQSRRPKDCSRVAFLEMADNTWNCHSHFFDR